MAPVVQNCKYNLKEQLWRLSKEIPTASYTDAATWLGGLIKGWALAAIAIDLLQIRVDNEQNGLNSYPPKCLYK